MWQAGTSSQSSQLQYAIMIMIITVTIIIIILPDPQGALGGFTITCKIVLIMVVQNYL